MALHDQLPIHKTGMRLLDLAVKVKVQLKRDVKQLLGERIMQHCIDMLDLMALANSSRGEVRVQYIEELLTKQRAVTVLLRVAHDGRWLLAPKLWADSIELLGSIGKQAGGWLKQSNKAPAA